MSLPYDEKVPIGEGPEIPEVGEVGLGGGEGTLDDPVEVDDLEVTVAQDDPSDTVETEEPPQGQGVTMEEIVAGLLIAAVVGGIVWALRNWTEGGQ